MLRLQQNIQSTANSPRKGGQPPNNPDAGFLPVDDANHDGEGFITYTVQPKAGLPTGTQITNQASIVFDTNAAISTPIALNTLDNGPPTSMVSPLPATTGTKTFTVSWSGTDDAGGSGVGSFDIYSSDNGGPLTPWLIGMTVAVTINGKPQSAPSTPLTRIVVYCQSGNNVVKEAPGVGVSAVMFGGSGNNTLSVSGSSAATTNVLVGGPGKNSLTGGSGRDILIGGGGAATLNAGKGDDILIGGSTSYDANLQALLSVMAEWARTDIGYVQRVQDLFGNGSGGYSGPLLDAEHVARDTAINQLVGNTTGGLDWFWFSDTTKAADKLSGYVSGKVATFE